MGLEIPFTKAFSLVCVCVCVMFFDERVFPDTHPGYFRVIPCLFFSLSNSDMNESFGRPLQMKFALLMFS